MVACWVRAVRRDSTTRRMSGSAEGMPWANNKKVWLPQLYPHFPQHPNATFPSILQFLFATFFPKTYKVLGSKYVYVVLKKILFLLSSIWNRLNYYPCFVSFHFASFPEEIYTTIRLHALVFVTHRTYQSPSFFSKFCFCCLNRTLSNLALYWNATIWPLGVASFLKR